MNWRIEKVFFVIIRNAPFHYYYSFSFSFTLFNDICTFFHFSYIWHEREEYQDENGNVDGNQFFSLFFNSTLCTLYKKKCNEAKGVYIIILCALILKSECVVTRNKKSKSVFFFLFFCFWCVNCYECTNEMYNRHWKRDTLCVKKENLLDTHMRVAHNHIYIWNMNTIELKMVLRKTVFFFVNNFFSLLLLGKRKTASTRSTVAHTESMSERECDKKNRQTNNKNRRKKIEVKSKCERKTHEKSYDERHW